MERSFCTGSQWLYYKIYTGSKTSDHLLLNELYPKIAILLKKGYIEKWFFIRYNDPKEHLRIRFYHPNPKKILKVIEMFHPLFKKHIEEDIIWKIQTDTYQREIERYGENTIEASETLFYHHSELIINYLDLKSSFENLECELLFSFLSINELMKNFLLSTSEKLEIMDALQASFKNEMLADKKLRKELDLHYRKIAVDMTKLLSGKSKEEHFEMISSMEENCNNTKDLILYIKKNLEIPLKNFVMAIIHMMVNRQFISNQRKYETIIYDHLHRYYKTLAFQEKSKSLS